MAENRALEERVRKLETQGALERTMVGLEMRVLVHLSHRGVVPPFVTGEFKVCGGGGGTQVVTSPIKMGQTSEPALPTSES